MKSGFAERPKYFAQYLGGKGRNLTELVIGGHTKLIGIHKLVDNKFEIKFRYFAVNVGSQLS